MKKSNTQPDIENLHTKDEMNTAWVNAWMEATERFLYLDNKLYDLKNAKKASK